MACDAFRIVQRARHVSKSYNAILRQEDGQRFVVVYFDDILIFSRNVSDHQRDVAWVLQKLRENQLYAKSSKCHFAVDRVNFCGYMLDANGVSPEN